MNSLKVFDELESEVRSYCRSFPTVFTEASGYRLWDKENKEYIDFFSGAGALNYGHNPPQIKVKIIEYLNHDGIVHSLDMATEAKKEFLEQFNQIILNPRKMKYKIMFTGPTGTNAVESSLKLARKVTGRDSIMCFTNAFHGMTMGSLSITGNAKKRQGAGIPLGNAVFMPYDGYLGENADTVDYIRRYLDDSSSGVSLPAAIILETLQGEGGLNVASYEWLRRIETLCREKDILLIVDDIQAGCGRTGTFFSFEPAGISPDIICLSKSISGYGLPMAITLIKPELDIWSAGEHNGTFRGHNLAFITATESLNYWKEGTLSKQVGNMEKDIRNFLAKMVKEHSEIKGEVRGRGFMQGIACGVDGLAEKICSIAFASGLIMETSGAKDEVIKIMPPLTIDESGLREGLNILKNSIEDIKVQSFINSKRKNVSNQKRLRASG
ncbi:MAG: diaminobutyrate--2-oxoglutarate transaminase [Syntrophomonas sp.]|uniref:diaminobutyrate--2-oxoglutarate transaminase n=1 Tax=Syntrophomonas sp. TaxID=2053627 RepID=UPI0026098683|nr:diaminobutyrate--2-oxoglutarate transaminase [Syntrophomonas sp.]MDD2510750.1 diaminobutyrate--2-oxoglutarate transaminase [Syntrophomonas sp.]MDD3879497.1 diaminobutyrate--2-oxoglutarate transaminase [Syntrophomonas sp.]MDD4626987.1 diaminobutyrate--2-oxoglutarate transaminase [Syntrophomonas sp.]